MDNNMKEVWYFHHCPNCKHLNEPDDEDACHFCLETPARKDSHKPINFEEKGK